MSHPSSHSQQPPFHFGGYNPVIDLITPIHSPTGVASVVSRNPTLIDLVSPEHSVIDLVSPSHSRRSNSIIDLVSSSKSKSKPRKGRRKRNDYDNLSDMSDISESDQSTNTFEKYHQRRNQLLMASKKQRRQPGSISSLSAPS